MRDVAIVGGGLAGLTALKGLRALGIDAHLFEASDRVGGRLWTDHRDEFTLDRGFQVFFEAYPHARQVLDLDALDLCRFPRGVKIWDGERTHLLDAMAPMTSLTEDVISMADKALLAKYAAQLRASSVEAIRAEPDGTTEDELRAVGFSEEFIVRFARPFYGGIFVEKRLNTSRRQFRFITKMLLHGTAGVPAAGMSAIPLQLARGLEAHISTSTAVASISADGVRLASGEAVAARHVLVAADYATAARLTGLPIPQERKAFTQILLDAPEPFIPGPHVCLNGTGRGDVDQVVTLDLTAPSYAHEGRCLVSIVVLAPDADVAATLAEVQVWRPEFPFSECRVLAKQPLPDAQMMQPPGIWERLAAIRENAPWFTLAGDYRANASIDGAIQSGLEAAARIAGRE